MDMATAASLGEANTPNTRGYQQEMLEESIKRNTIIAMDTGSGKTHIAVLRIKYEVEREPSKVAWFFAPTVALCAQQKAVIQTYLPVSVGLVSGALEPDQWKSTELWKRVLSTHRVIVSTPQVFLDALRHAYINLGKDISLLVFDEAHHATGDHPYTRIMVEFYHRISQVPSNERIFGVNQVSHPYVMGLTASPIYGGNVEKAFNLLEKNLDCVIRAPRLTRTELAQFVHRPVFQHVMYDPWPVPPFSTNLVSASNVIRSLHIDDDPYIISLREKLSQAQPDSPEYFRIDQKLSKTIRNQKTFTLKGLRDFERAASDILYDLGPWAADWYVWRVVEKARDAANPYNSIMSNWKASEKNHLLKVLDSIILTPVSYHPDDIIDCSDKVQQLIMALLNEKLETESQGEVHSGLIFVQRRDSVIALAEVLNHHPFTKDLFRIGVLLGTSDNTHRHSFLDITRKLARDAQEETIADFRSGELNLIVATAVAEEGLDIQACGSVIRWDLPPNMASWAQSRGRARRERSTFTLMFARGSQSQQDVGKWEELERQMVEKYNDPSRDLVEEEPMSGIEEEIEEERVFIVESTGAQLDLHSAIAHLSHFCAILPIATHVDNRPIYDIDPPDMPEGWHSHSAPQLSAGPLYAGPWGSKVTLPRCLPLPCREFSVPRIYRSKVSAHRNVAFMAYRGLYEAGLLNNNLLPLMSVLEPEKEADVQEMLKDVEKRSGMATVDMQMDPWAGSEVDLDGDSEGASRYWWTTKMCIGDLPPLRLFTRSDPTELGLTDGPMLHHPGKEEPIRVTLAPVAKVMEDEDVIYKAREYTRRVFWSLNWARMDWNNLDFAYLVYPEFPLDDDDVWVKYRTWSNGVESEEEKNCSKELVVSARRFGEAFGYVEDPVLILKEFGRPYQFVSWRTERLSDEEEAEVQAAHRRLEGRPPQINYPLLVVKPFHSRRNFLVPSNPRDPNVTSTEAKYSYLMPEYSAIALISTAETEYALLLPSALRYIGTTLTMISLRSSLFPPASPLRVIPLDLLAHAMTTTTAGEVFNYQRLETLGDTVLKFLVALQVLVEYPFWHEGYLTKKKDHTVSNVRLAKENVKRRLFRWLIRETMLGRKWKPNYMSKHFAAAIPDAEELEVVDALMVVDELRENEKSSTRMKGTRQKKEEFSTKVLADIVESLIGAAYVHGGLTLGYECTKLFDLGLKWLPPPDRIRQFHARLEHDFTTPPELHYVEQMIGYTFKHKILLLEALTHASYQQDARTVSYERMEFLGDSVLDMVVTDYLYHVPGKKYSPGHIHLRRSSVVNTHFLAFICLSISFKFDAKLPNIINGHVHLEDDAQEIALWKCLLHSSSRVMDDQANTFSRFRNRRKEIEDALQNDSIFPWAGLTRLQAPKLFSDIIESVIGAVFLDSHGDIGTAREVIRHLGILSVLERIVGDNVDVWHPVSRISQWAQKHGKELEFKLEKEKGVMKCSVVVDGVVEAIAKDEYRGLLSTEEVKLVAAEGASRKLRFRNMHMDQQLVGKGKGSGKGGKPVYVKQTTAWAEIAAQRDASEGRDVIATNEDRMQC